MDDEARKWQPTYLLKPGQYQRVSKGPILLDFGMREAVLYRLDTIDRKLDDESVGKS